MPTPSLLADPLPPRAPVEPALAPARVGWCDLTRRETEIVQLIADGAGNKQVAAALRISEWTVETHVRRIFIKLGVRSRAAMVYRYALFKSSTAGPR